MSNSQTEREGRPSSIFEGAKNVLNSADRAALDHMKRVMNMPQATDRAALAAIKTHINPQVTDAERAMMASSVAKVAQARNASMGTRLDDAEFEEEFENDDPTGLQRLIRQRRAEAKARRDRARAAASGTGSK